MHDLQTKLRGRTDTDVLGDAGEDLRQILLLVVDHLLLASLSGPDDALRNVRVDRGHERLEKRTPVADAFAVEGLSALDDRGPLLRHHLEVSALHVPRKVEVELFVHVTLVERHRLRVFNAHHAEDDLVVAVLLV